MSFKEQFTVPARYRMWSMVMMGVGVLALIIGFIMYGGVDHGKRFWSALLQNSTYFLLIANASMFFICATTLAMGGWQMGFRRVTEAISVAVIPLGIIAFIVLIALVATNQHEIYHWLDKEHVAHDKVLSGKSGFLNAKFYIIWTTLAIGLWIVLGRKMRQLSDEIDQQPLKSVEEGRRYIYRNTIWASLFTVWFGLTVAATVPWFWLMSIDAHWYSTMYSWYTFASTFVAGIALITLFVIYLKNHGYLELVNEEHLHDLGKFMFAFSIFWTYLWFSQYMLIWYANIPEETTYFKVRVQGPYRGMFFLNLVVNFLAPLLIFMRRNAKRNYTLVTFMSVLIIVGHWLDFYQMVFPGVFPEGEYLNLFDVGVAIGFVGLIMFVTGNALEKRPLLAKNHPFFKESIIHHT